MIETLCHHYTRVFINWIQSAASISRCYQNGISKCINYLWWLFNVSLEVVSGISLCNKSNFNCSNTCRRLKINFYWIFTFRWIEFLLLSICYVLLFISQFYESQKYFLFLKTNVPFSSSSVHQQFLFWIVSFSEWYIYISHWPK